VEPTKIQEWKSDHTWHWLRTKLSPEQLSSLERSKLLPDGRVHNLQKLADIQYVLHACRADVEQKEEIAKLVADAAAELLEQRTFFLHSGLPWLVVL
jgi:hypothetical protein